MLQDIAIVTGGTVVSEELGYDLKSVSMDMLGTAHSVKISKENTVIVSGSGAPEAIQDRIKQIKNQIEENNF